LRREGTRPKAVRKKEGRGGKEKRTSKTNKPEQRINGDALLRREKGQKEKKRSAPHGQVLSGGDARKKTHLASARREIPSKEKFFSAARIEASRRNWRGKKGQ